MSRKKLCDVCSLRDGHMNRKLIHCTECQLSVHKDCYGMDSYEKTFFSCWACRAVGKSFQVEAHDKNGNRLQILQSSRPKNCVLCSIQHGTHAMHPLYDASGTKGRQIYLEESNKTLAWAHTLCAFFLTGSGFLYGCSRDGGYDNYEDQDDANEDSDDDRSNNPELIDGSAETSDYGEYAPVHHFVYRGGINARGEARDEDALVGRKISQLKQLKCYACGADDKPKDVLRICLQCDANDDEEFIKFKGKHASLADGESCTTALHAGCARWGGNNKHDVQRIYYYTGSDDIDSIISLYCNIHAEDVDQKYQKKKKALQVASSSPSPVLHQTMQEAQPRRTSHTNPPRRREKEKDPTLEKVSNDLIDALQVVSSSPSPSPVLHQTMQKAQPRRTSHTNPPRGTSHAKPPRRREKEKDQTLEKVSNDLIRRVSRVQNFELKEKTFTERKRYWERELSNMPLGQFKSLWKDAKLSLAKAIEHHDFTAVRKRSATIGRRSNMTQRVASSQHAPHFNERHIMTKPNLTGEGSETKNYFDDNNSDTSGIGWGSDSEFEWRGNEGDRDADGHAAPEGEGTPPGPQNLWSQLCHPGTISCECARNLLDVPGWRSPGIDDIECDGMRSPRKRAIRGQGHANTLVTLCVADDCHCTDHCTDHWDL